MLKSKDIERIRRQCQKIHELANLRLNDFGACANQLAAEAERLSRKAAYVRRLIIVLGALVATKGIADQLMLDFKDNHTLHMLILVIYTLIGFLISIAAGLESFFQFTKKASVLNQLASYSFSCARRYMSGIQIDLFYDKPEDKLKVARMLLDEMNDELSDIYYEAANHGINLTLLCPIDYTDPMLVDNHDTI